jgi:hypothetical protein
MFFAADRGLHWEELWEQAMLNPPPAPQRHNQYRGQRKTHQIRIDAGYVNKLRSVFPG